MDWSQALARTVHVREYGTLRTLEDARHLVLEVLPPELRENQIWRHVAGEMMMEAACGTDILSATVALELALVLGQALER